jgi:hypothetical protein
MTSPSAFAALRSTVSVVGSCTGRTTPAIEVITAGFYCPRNGLSKRRVGKGAKRRAHAFTRQSVRTMRSRLQPSHWAVGAWERTFCIITVPTNELVGVAHDRTAAIIPIAQRPVGSPNNFCGGRRLFFFVVLFHLLRLIRTRIKSESSNDSTPS